jgi:nucleoside-diphosphate-sugar epimerase
MKILITGGAGYIGSFITKKFSNIPEINSITCIDSLFFNQDFKNISNKIKNVKGDVRDKNKMKDLYKSHDIIIPLAALVGAPICKKYPNDTKEINFKVIEHMCKNLSSSQVVIMPVTNSGYGIGEKNKFCDENSPLKPISLYGRTKVMAEEAIMQRQNSVSFRLATVFGVSDRMRIDLLVNNFTYIAYFEKILEIFEPHFRRNYIHISDIFNAFNFTINNFDKLKGEIYNLGLSDANLTKEQLCKEIKKIIPNFKYIISNKGTDEDKRDYFVSNDKIEQKGFKASFKLEDGIKELVNLYSKPNFVASKNC